MDNIEDLKDKSGQEYLELVCKQSEFNTQRLGDYVAHFLSMFYGEKFVYAVGRCSVNDKNMVYKYVARRKDKKEHLDLNDVSNIYKDEEIVILDVSRSLKNNMTSIYTLEDGMLFENGKLTDIVKEFIDRLILIKVNGNVCDYNNVTNVEYSLLNKYYDIVKENYDLLYEYKKEKLLAELNSQFQEKYSQLNRVLKK